MRPALPWCLQASGISGIEARMPRLALAAALTFALDQLSKWWIVFHLDLATRGRIEVLPGLIEFRMAWNRGVNFGLLGSASELTRWGLALLAVAVSGWIALYAHRRLPRTPDRILAGLVVGGALGNALDRVLYGAVADFLNVTCCGIDNPFSFNIADIGVVCGALGLAFFARPAEKEAGTGAERTGG